MRLTSLSLDAPESSPAQTHKCTTFVARSKLIREGQEDYEYLRMAEQKVGRAAVLKAMAPVMTTATKYTHEPLDIFEVSGPPGARSDLTRGGGTGRIKFPRS